MDPNAAVPPAPTSSDPNAQAPTPPAGAQPAATPPKTFTQDEVGQLISAERGKVKDSSRKAIFDKIQVKDESELEALVKAAREAEAARLTETEKAQKRTKDLETELATARAQAAASAAEAKKARVLAEARPVDVELFEALYDKAASADGFDAKAWVEAQKKARPALFEVANAAAQQPANSGVRPPPPANGASGAQAPFDARKAKPDELRARATALGLDPNLFRS